MRQIIIIVITLILSIPISAQNDDLTPYEIALERIEEVERSGATVLDLSNLGLTELPSELWELVNLELLYINLNDLKFLPSDVAKLTNLGVLDVSNNEIEYLPPEIGNLYKLEFLYAYNNLFTDLPPEIGNLSNLLILHVSGNQISNLPDEMGNLSNLCALFLTSNQLRYLPTSLGQVSHLDQNWCYGTDTESGIRLAGNPLISPPPEVIEQGTPAILDYLRNRARWHLQRLILGIASSVGIIALVGLFLLRRRRNLRKPKQKHTTSGHESNSR